MKEETDQAVEVLKAEGCSGTPGGGRYVILRLTVQSDTILDCSFESNGCPAAHTAVGGLVAFIMGRRLDQAALLDPKDLLILIGGLPDGKGYYASMAIEALRDAIDTLPLVPMSRVAEGEGLGMGGRNPHSLTHPFSGSQGSGPQR